jgi:hypothetical protein
MSAEQLAITEHAKIFDPLCPICAHKQRVLIEKWYVQRRPMPELVSIFKISEPVFHLHARTLKLFKKRANNTAAIVDLVLEGGLEKLRAGEFEMTIKDVAWAVGHRDKLLGRIKEKVEVTQHPILIMHTTVPGVGGIANEDVAQIKAAKVLEALPSMKDLVIEGELLSADDEEIPTK